MSDLAKRAVACKGFGWRLGMRVITKDGSRLRLVGHCVRGLWFDELAEEMVNYRPDDPIPDLTDAATLGCLLQVVRDAYDLPCWLAPNRSLASWYVDAQSGSLSVGSTEAEALVAALEAAP